MFDRVFRFAFIFTLSFVEGARTKTELATALLDKVRDVSDSSLSLQESHHDEADNPFSASSEESLAWLNTLLREIWPQTNQAINEIVKHTVNPLLASSLPSVLSSLQVDPFDLSEAPTFGSIAVYKSREGVKIKLGVHFRTDNKISISSRGGILNTLQASAGINQLSLDGDLIIHLAPIIGQMPVIGGLRVYFLNAPNIQIDFSGLANVGNITGVSTLVRNAINSALANALVLPNCIGIPLATPEQGVHASYFDQPSPIGLVKVSIIQARNLTRMDWGAFGMGKSDPYVTVETADRSWSSATISDSSNPKWKEGNTRNFLIYDKRQTIQFTVYDKDRLSSDDVIGFAAPLTYARAMGEHGRGGMATMPLTRKEKGRDIDAGQLTATFERLDFAACGEPGSEEFVLLIEVDRIMMPAAVATAASAVFLVNGESKATAKGQMPVSVAAVYKDIVERMHNQNMGVSQIADLTGLAEAQVEQLVHVLDAPTGEYNGLANLHIGSKLYFPNIIRSDAIDVKIFDATGKNLAEGRLDLEPLHLQRNCVSRQAFQISASPKIIVHFDVKLLRIK